MPRLTSPIRALAASALVIAAVAPAAAHAATGDITHFTLPQANAHTTSVTKGPDGNMWFVEQPTSGALTTDGTLTREILRVTPQGALTEFDAGLGAEIDGITSGPNGHIWFADNTNGVLGEMSPDGTYTPHMGLGITGVKDLVGAPDGNLYVLKAGGTDEISEYSGPTLTETDFPIAAGANAQSIVVGPDGNLWFSELNLDKIGVLDIHATPHVVHEYDVAVAGAPAGTTVSPRGIIGGPDGNIWFTETGGGVSERLAHVSTAGTGNVQTDVLGGGFTDPEGLAVGADGGLWAVAHNGGAIIHASPTSSALTTYSNGIQTGATPLKIAADATGSLWVSDDTHPIIYRVQVDAPVVAPPPPPPVVAPPVAPTLTKLSLTHSSFQVGTPSKKNTKLGTTIRFTLSTASSVKLSFAKLTTGRKLGTKCVLATHARRHLKTCTRSTSVGSKTIVGKAGVNSATFTGKLSKALSPGRYSVTFVATAANELSSKPASATFTIVAAPTPKHTTTKKKH